MSKYLDDNKTGQYEGYYRKDILISLHLFIDSYLKEPRNFSRETRELLQATRDKRPTRSEMSIEERRLDEIARANEATNTRRKEEGNPRMEPDIQDLLERKEGKLTLRKLL